MHILIVSSEELYKENITSSIFELSQAKALKNKNVKVSILVVNTPYTFLGLLKHMLYRCIGIRDENWKYKKKFNFLFYAFIDRLIGYIFQLDTNKQDITNIEGIDVYSTTVIPFTSRYKIENLMSRWEFSALKLFSFYLSKNGMPDLIHAHSRFLYGGHFAYILKKKYAIKYILTEHSSYYKNVFFSEKVTKSAIEMISEACLYLVVSKSLIPYIKNKTGLNNIKYEVLPNILDEEFELTPLLLPKKEQRELYIIHVASYSDDKNQVLLIKSFAKSFRNQKNIKLKLVGEGLREGLIKLCSSEGIKDQVVFTGKIYDKKKIIEELDQSAFLVLSSRVETFGVVLIEAFSRGLPVVSTKCGGPEYIINNENGLLVENTVESFSEGIIQMVDTYKSYDPELIRNYAINTYGSHVISNQLIDFYKKHI